MALPEEALISLRRVLEELGFDKEFDISSDAELEELAMFLLNLTSAAVKTRERMRLLGKELPTSETPSEKKAPEQPTLPGFSNWCLGRVIDEIDSPS